MPRNGRFSDEETTAAAKALMLFNLDGLESVSESFARFFDDESERSKFSDLVLACGDRVWKVHSLFIRRVPLFRGEFLFFVFFFKKKKNIQF